MNTFAYQDKISVKTKLLNFFRGFFQSRIPENLLAKSTNNHLPTSFLARFVPPEYCYPRGSMRTVKRDFLHYSLDLSNVVDHFIYFGFSDPAFDNLLKLIKSDFTIIDVGANIGRFALPFAKLALTGSVIAYEPDSANFEKIKVNKDLNKLVNLTLFKKGLGSVIGSQKLMQVNENNTGMNRIFHSDLKEFAYENVEISTIDVEVSLQQIKNVDLIKVDVEGFEWEVLIGASKTLEKFRPILFIEVSNDNLSAYGNSADSLIKWVTDRQYKVVVASTLAPVMSTDLHKQFDIICIPDQN